MFGDFSLEYGAITLVTTFSILLSLSLFDTCDAERMFSRRER
jgi:hypothetical protein